MEYFLFFSGDIDRRLQDNTKAFGDCAVAVAAAVVAVIAAIVVVVVLYRFWRCASIQTNIGHPTERSAENN